jgi:hypothetical protein
VIVGAHGDAVGPLSDAGRATIFYTYGPGGSQTLTSKLPEGDAQFGQDVAVGQVDHRFPADPNDRDLLIGEFNWPGGGMAPFPQERGRLVVYFDGKRMPSDALIVDIPLLPNHAFARWTWCVASHDFDLFVEAGKQWDDVAAGSPVQEGGDQFNSPSGGPNPGALFVLRGGSTFGTPAQTVWMLQSVIPPAAAYDAFGLDSAFGYVDGDAWGDLVVGEPGSLAQRATIFFGENPNGPTAQFTRFFQVADPTPTPTSRFGFSVAVGNWDGAQFDDLVVSAPTEDRLPASEIPNKERGEVWVFKF